MRQLWMSVAIAFLTFLLTILAIVSIDVWFSPAQADSITTMYVDVDYGSCLNIREDQNTNSGLVIRKHRGDEVYATREDAGWTLIVCADGNINGWAMSEYLTYDKPEMKPTGTYRVIGDGRVAVRKKDGDVLWKEVGSTVTVSGWDKSDGVLWALVRGGRMDSNYLEVVQ